MMSNALLQVLSPTYKSRSEDFKKTFKDISNEERLVVGEIIIACIICISLWRRNSLLVVVLQIYIYCHLQNKYMYTNIIYI